MRVCVVPLCLMEWTPLLGSGDSGAATRMRYAVAGVAMLLVTFLSCPLPRIRLHRCTGPWSVT
jgi:hypothetical protein